MAGDESIELAPSSEQQATELTVEDNAVDPDAPSSENRSTSSCSHDSADVTTKTETDGDSSKELKDDNTSVDDKLSTTTSELEKTNESDTKEHQEEQQQHEDNQDESGSASQTGERDEKMRAAYPSTADAAAMKEQAKRTEETSETATDDVQANDHESKMRAAVNPRESSAAVPAAATAPRATQNKVNVLSADNNDSDGVQAGAFRVEGSSTTRLEQPALQSAPMAAARRPPIEAAHRQPSEHSIGKRGSSFHAGIEDEVVWVQGSLVMEELPPVTTIENAERSGSPTPMIMSPQQVDIQQQQQTQQQQQQQQQQPLVNTDHLVVENVGFDEGGHPTLPVAVRRSADDQTDVQVMNVYMDEGRTGNGQHQQSHIPFVNAAPMDDDFKLRDLCVNRKIQCATIGLVLLTVMMTLGIDTLRDMRKSSGTSFYDPTGAPTSSFGNDQFTFLELLPDKTQMAVKNVTSPQYRAYDWLWNYDELNYGPLPINRRIQRFALAVSFFSLTAYGSWDEALSETDWLRRSHECDWSTNLPSGAACRDDEFIVLDLANFGLEGTLPPEISLLTNLVSVDLSFNYNIIGTLPTELGLMSNLEALLLYSNKLTGTIPTQIGQMIMLARLWLFDNQLVSTIPTEMGQLSRLQMLQLDSNYLTGSIPKQFGKLSELAIMGLHVNHFTGAIPTELGSLNLEALALSETGIQGTIPTEFGRLTDMDQLFLHETRLSGTIPTELDALQELQVFSVYNTSVTGSVPPGMCSSFTTGVLNTLIISCSNVTCSCGCNCTKADRKAMMDLTNHT